MSGSAPVPLSILYNIYARFSGVNYTFNQPFDFSSRLIFLYYHLFNIMFESYKSHVYLIMQDVELIFSFARHIVNAQD